MRRRAPHRSAFALGLLALAGTASAEATPPAEPPPPALQPPPASPAPAPPAVTVAPVAAPPPTLPPPAPALDPSLDALVHVALKRPEAWLEGRTLVDADEWEQRCAVPCDRVVRVDGQEFRVVANGMTPSNAFVIHPGPGVARLSVSPGSSTARTLGIIGLAGGLPVAFAGVALFGMGKVNDEDGMQAAGVATLAVGAVAVVASLPLLLLGSTAVKNDERRTIARAPLDLRF